MKQEIVVAIFANKYKFGTKSPLYVTMYLYLIVILQVFETSFYLTLNDYSYRRLLNSIPLSGRSQKNAKPIILLAFGVKKI